MLRTNRKAKKSLGDGLSEANKSPTKGEKKKALYTIIKSEESDDEVPLTKKKPRKSIPSGSLNVNANSPLSSPIPPPHTTYGTMSTPTITTTTFIDIFVEAFEPIPKPTVLEQTASEPTVT